MNDDEWDQMMDHANDDTPGDPELERELDDLVREVEWLRDKIQAVRDRRRKRVPYAVGDPRRAYTTACAALIERNVALTKQNIATEMGVDRGTLNGYIRDFGLPYPPEIPR